MYIRQRSCESQAKKMDTTQECSRLVPHGSTNSAQPGLTSEFGRDRVYSPVMWSYPKVDKQSFLPVVHDKMYECELCAD